LSSNTSWYNPTQAFAMLVGRFLLIIPVLAMAGTLGHKQPVAASAGTFPTDRPLFAGLLLGIVVIVAGLTFFPVLALGPIAEALSQ
jgi:K+-transporting ATPase ATPase A chain